VVETTVNRVVEPRSIKEGDFMKKIFSLLITLSFICSSISYALPGDLNPSMSMPDQKIESVVPEVLGLVQWIGYAVAIGMLVFIGIKYVMSAADEKASLKKGSINYLIGAIVVFAASTVMGWIKTFVETNVS
jgi:zinc transporter ZupT